MPPDERYAIEKLWVAVQTLAAGTGDIRERLFDASAPHLVVLDPQDFPEDLRTEFESVTSALTWLPAEEEDGGTLRSTVGRMSEAEARRTALRIVALFYAMVNRFPEAR